MGDWPSAAFLAGVDGRLSDQRGKAMTGPAIVIVTSSFPISGDGSEAAGSFVADLAEETAKHQAVRVVAPGHENGRECLANGIEVFRYAAPARALSTLKPWDPRDAISIAGVLNAGARATECAINHGPTAHLIALWALPCGYWARRSAARHGLSYSVWTLGSDIWSLGRIPLVRGLLARVLGDASRCWSDGFELRAQTQLIAGRQVDFLPSTRKIDANRAAPARLHPPYRLLFLGRWHPNKGVDLLLQALELLNEADWALIEDVHIAGGGPLHDLVVDSVAKLRTRGRPVRLSGYLGHDDARQALATADRLLLPSRIESIPVIFSDAMKFGLPVVAMPVGDLPELIPQGTGTVAATVEPASYADALRANLRSAFDPDALCSMAERFSLESIAATVVASARERCNA